MKILFTRHPELVPNFRPPGGPPGGNPPEEPPFWAAMTANAGPETVSYKHRDYANLANGWCAITCFGDFDYTLGGHLILWDMKIAIEFPPGSTILIPSAILEHSNAALHPKANGNNIRYSLTFYTAGGLFRWVENGCRTAAAFEKEDPKGKAEVDEYNKGRFERGLRMFSTLDALRLGVKVV